MRPNIVKRFTCQSVLFVHTGKFTSRSPKDRYFVKTADNENLELIFLSGSNHGYR